MSTVWTAVKPTSWVHAARQHRQEARRRGAHREQSIAGGPTVVTSAPGASDCWLTVMRASRLRVPMRIITPSATLPTTDPRARAGLCRRMTGYMATAMAAPLAAQVNSMSAVQITRLSLAATWFT